MAMDEAAPVETPVETPAASCLTVYRHRVATRLWHWVNAVTIFIMIGSGVGILKAHPHLYWGQYGANFDRPWLSLKWMPGWVGTGLNYLAIPGNYNLALSRRWHLFFALILGLGLLIFMVVSLINRHFQRDLRVGLRELAPRVLWHDLRAHLALRFHDAANPRAYNILQKLAYVGVIFIAIPLLILTGLTMSPNMNAAWPWLLDLFGGRQSARSIHFIAAFAITVFIVVHLALVILSGAWNGVRSMITGRWNVPEDAP